MSNWDETVSEIMNERTEQLKQWGNDNDDIHTPLNWVGLIAYYSSRWIKLRFSPIAFRKSMIQAAALCIAAIDYIDRKMEREPSLK